MCCSVLRLLLRQLLIGVLLGLLFVLLRNILVRFVYQLMILYLEESDTKEKLYLATLQF